MEIIFLRVCAVICVTGLVSVTAQTINDTKTLLHDRLNGYNKYVRPVANQSDAVQVGVDLHVLAIQEFDEVQETLSVVGILGIYWFDASMVWNPGDYNGVSYFMVSFKDVWVPDMILTNPAQEINTMGDDWQRVHFLYYGYAGWSAGSSLKTTCSVNMLYFPFDTQECDITFYPWGYNQREVKVTTLEDEINLEFYSENGAWSVVGSSTRTEILGGGSQVTFTMKIKRKPGFVVVNVLLPILFLSLINVVVFILPVESGERVSYCITVLLSIAVFMTIISDTLPRNSEPLPIIAYILMVEMMLSALTTLIVILNIKLYHRSETTPVPIYLRKMVKKRHHLNRNKVGNADILNKNPLKDVVVETVIQDMEKEETKGNLEGVFSAPNCFDMHDPPVSWKEVSGLLDKLSLCIILVGNLLCVSLFMIVTLTGGN